MAFEWARAEADGITIGTLLVDDDVAVKDSTYTVAGVVSPGTSS